MAIYKTLSSVKKGTHLHHLDQSILKKLSVSKNKTKNIEYQLSFQTVDKTFNGSPYYFLIRCYFGSTEIQYVAMENGRK